MDYFSVYSKIKFDGFNEEIYTEDDSEELFKEELCLAIMDSCGFNKSQAEIIYCKVYKKAHWAGLSAIVSTVKDYSEFVREIINVEDKK